MCSLALFRAPSAHPHITFRLPTQFFPFNAPFPEALSIMKTLISVNLLPLLSHSFSVSLLFFLLSLNENTQKLMEKHTKLIVTCDQNMEGATLRQREGVQT